MSNHNSNTSENTSASGRFFSIPGLSVFLSCRVAFRRFSTATLKHTTPSEFYRNENISIFLFYNLNYFINSHYYLHGVMQQFYFSIIYDQSVKNINFLTFLFIKIFTLKLEITCV